MRPRTDDEARAWITRWWDPESTPWSPANATTRLIDTSSGRAVRVRPRRHRVAIVGGAPSRVEAPWFDPSTEIWGLNGIPSLDPRGVFRADRFFQIHEEPRLDPVERAWLSVCPVPIYTAGQECENANALPYPIEAVVAKYPDYFAVSFAYEIALALLEGFTEIGLFGVELPSGTLRERTVEWACLSFWIGFAKGRGVRVTLPETTTLAWHPARYGLQYDDEVKGVEAYLRTVPPPMTAMFALMTMDDRAKLQLKGYEIHVLLDGQDVSDRAETADSGQGWVLLRDGDRLELQHGLVMYEAHAIDRHLQVVNG